MRDLRPRRQLEAERNKSERLAAVVETAVTVNHEINNPLFVITSSVEALRRSLFDADSSVREKLDRISEACRRVERFTQQLGSVIAPVSKEYLPGLKMLDIQQSVAVKAEAARTPSTATKHSHDASPALRPRRLRQHRLHPRPGAGRLCPRRPHGRSARTSCRSGRRPWPPSSACAQ